MTTTRYTVEKWYDRSTRSWVVQTKDQEGNQVGDATYVYSQREAQIELMRREREVNRNDERDNAAAGELPL